MGQDASSWVGAGVAIFVAIAVVAVLRVLFARRHLDLPPEAATRLRLIERFIYALVLLVGIAIALSKFDSVREVSRALLTSSAIAAAVVGFAARQVLANVVAGLMLAVTQPLRLGDRIAIDDDLVGVVEDVSLSYTFLRAPSGERVAVPNERLASSILHNDTMGGAQLSVDADVWIAPDGDAARAVALLQDLNARAAEATPQGIRIGLSAGTATAAERPARQDALRAQALARLRGEGLLPSAAN